jgi:hypothetical protein
VTGDADQVPTAVSPLLWRPRSGSPIPGPQSKVTGTDAWALRVISLVSEGTSQEGEDAVAAMGRLITDGDWGARARWPSHRGGHR